MPWHKSEVTSNFASFKGKWYRHEHDQYYPNSRLGNDRRFEWRKKEPRSEHNNASPMKPSYPSITFPNHYLEVHIDLLKDTTLIGMFGPNLLPLSIILDWARSIWQGVKEVFFIDSQCNYFIVLFDSKASRDSVHKYKGGFVKGKVYSPFHGQRIWNLMML